MLEVAAQIALDPGEMLEIGRLAVALVEAGEDAGDLGVALRAKDRIGAGEIGEVEIRRIGPARRALPPPPPLPKVRQWTTATCMPN